MNKESLKLGLILGAIALTVSLILAYANSVTKPIIEERQTADTKSALMQVLPAETYVKEELPQGVSGDVSEIYTAKNGETVAGFCVKVAPSGYGGEITMIVGIANDKVCGVTITDMNETPGLGTRAKENGFISQFKDKAAPFKVNKDGGGIQAISGATISSRAVTNGVNHAAEAAKMLAGGAK